MIYYTNLRDARLEVKAATEKDHDDEYLLRAIGFVSKRLEEETCLQFAPYLADHDYDYGGRNLVTPYHLFLDHPLLALTTIANGNGSAISSGYTLTPRNSMPKGFIQLGATQWASGVINVSGTWGFHRNYPLAWFNSGDTVQNNPLTDIATTLTVTNAAGADVYLRSPRFSPGQLLRIENEFLLVQEVANATTLQVLRGQRGTTAAAHAQATAIDIWETEEVIQRAAMKWAGLLLKRRGAFEQVQYDSAGALVRFPKDMPEEIKGILEELDTMTWRTL